MHEPKHRGHPLASLKPPHRFGNLPERRDVFRKPKLVKEVDGLVFSTGVFHYRAGIRLRVPVAVPRRVKEDGGDLKRVAEGRFELVKALRHVGRHVFLTMVKGKLLDLFCVVHYPFIGLGGRVQRQSQDGVCFQVVSPRFEALVLRGNVVLASFASKLIFARI